MACSLEELHQVHYEMLYKFGDYCEKHSLNYVLHGGTLLGAVRHDGIIPWDDDVDVIMDIKSFNKLVKLLKKEPVDGLFLQWLNSDKKYAYNYSKFRMNGTEMKDWPYYRINVHNGVWMDVFVYLDKPKTNFGVRIQENLLKLFAFTGAMLVYKVEPGSLKISSGINSKLIKLIPDFIISLIRKLLFFLLSHSGRKGSDFVRDFDFNGEHNFKEPRSCFEPAIFHKFGDRELRIPENYDKLLRIIYGDDYMTPIQTHTHVNLDYVNLNSGV